MAAEKKKAKASEHQEAPEQMNEDAAPASEAPAESTPADDQAQYKDQLLRTLAEMENLKKRTEREKAETLKYAVAGFARDLLDVADNLRRALDSLPEGEAAGGLKTFIDGVKMTEKEILKVFEKAGIQKIEALGQPFDYNIHQAVAEVDAPDAKPGTVVHVMQSGYMLKDRLLRPAMVAVAKGGTDTPPPDIEGIDTTA